MKSLAFVLLLCCALPARAQKEHSFAIAIDAIQNFTPHSWKGADRTFKNFSDRSNPGGLNYGIWGAYYYRNTFSARIGASYLHQRVVSDHNVDGHWGEYNPSISRNATFADVAFGYNLLHNIAIRGISGWIYAGGGKTLGLGGGQSGSIDGADRERRRLDLYPLVQMQLKYNPLPFIFVGIGGSYRYFYPDVQPVSANVSVGFQL